VKNLAGYLYEESLPAGSTLTVAADSQGREFSARLVRLTGPRGDFRERSPWFGTEPVPGTEPVTNLRASQLTRAGSYAHTAPTPSILGEHGMSLVLWIWPGMLPTPGEATLLSQEWESSGIQLALESSGHVVVHVWDGDERILIQSDGVVAARAWSAIAVTIDPRTGRIDLVVANRSELGALAVTPTHAPGTDIPGLPQESAPIVLGARRAGSGTGAEPEPEPVGIFNGKIDRPRVWGQAMSAAELADVVHGREAPASPLAEWIFGAAPDTPAGAETGVDRSGNGNHLTLVNRPQVGVTGHLWTGDVIDFRQSPAEYSAVRLHSDDLSDAGWSPTFSMALPEALDSGVYAVELSCTAETGAVERDLIPVYVRPNVRHKPKADVLYLAPTLTYLAYGNDRQHATSDFGDMTESRPPGPYEDWIDANPQFGSSLYDPHPDGDGISYSSSRRPLGNVRPDYVSWITGCPRHFSGDLAILSWLEHSGTDFDVATDHDLHREGVDLLADYPVVITGSHPEYVSRRMLDGLAGYLSGPGRLMYLGGNGFYWVTGVSDDGSIEVRRGHAGTRVSETLPGEDVLAVSSEVGGLWRHRGRSPNELVGIGFAAQGWSGGAAYEVASGVPADIHRLVFGDLPAGTVFGGFGSLGGAAGDEVDRFDTRHGSPANTIVLASSQQFTDVFQPAVEDHLTITPGIGGSQNRDVRSDMTYLKHEGGGSVFSVGSISWTSCLPVNDFDNDIATVATNVLKAFVSGAL
jgi:N,N-dimethylformamidase